MERYCGCFDNKYECGFVLLVVLFMSVLFYNDSHVKVINERQNKRQAQKHGVAHNNHKNKQGYRSPRKTGMWRNNTVALFGRSFDEWSNLSSDVTLASHISVDAPTEQKA